MTVSGPESDEPGGSCTTSSVPGGSGGVALTEAAREIFVERGYHGASIRDVAKRAGLSLSALYYWHSGKQELLAALLEGGVNDYFRTCESAPRTTSRLYRGPNSSTATRAPRPRHPRPGG